MEFWECGTGYFFVSFAVENLNYVGVKFLDL